MNFVLLSLTDKILSSVIPHYAELQILINLGIVFMFMVIARMVTKDWRLIFLAGVVGFLAAFGYLP